MISKTLVKKYIPKVVKVYIIKLKDAINGKLIKDNDFKRFKRYYSNSGNISQAQVDTRLNFYSHSIEKGLSHDEIRYGFGKIALENLSKAIEIYKTKGFSENSIAYQNTLSVIKEYTKLHKSANYDISYLDKLFDKYTIDRAIRCSNNLGGATTVSAKDKKSNSHKNFKDLFIGRSSIRTFSSDPVDIEKIKNAIEYSMKAPSVCNRQSSRVYVIDNKEKIEKTLKEQGGMNGYPIPPVLIAITSSISGFVHITERNQPYIDGGIFSMALMLFIEQQGLAACPLNAMFNIKTESKIRSIINIKPDENIIMFIAVGNFKEVNNIAKSFRYSGDSITTFIK